MVDLEVLPLDKKINYQASKWTKLQALLDAEEFARLLNEAKAFLYEMAGPVSLPEACARYQAYSEALSQGREPKPDPFAWNWTLDPAALYWLDTGVSRQIRIRKPVVQIIHHQMNYTPDDNTFRSNLFGQDMISWGIQFAFPQLYEDYLTGQIIQLKDPALYPNVGLFRFLQKWLRENTLPTPFETVNAPQRIGKKALSWVGRHPHLIKKGIKCKQN